MDLDLNVINFNWLDERSLKSIFGCNIYDEIKIIKSLNSILL